MIETERVAQHQMNQLPPSNKLGFGQIFCDHWFFSKYKEGRGWYQSQVAPYGPIEVDPAAAVLHYGQALFEGMKAFTQVDGTIVLFRPDFNYHRMVEGAARLCLQAPPQELFMKALKDLITLESHWVPKDQEGSLYIRPTIIGTEGFLGVRPAKEIMFFIILSPVGSYYGRGSASVKIWVEDKALRAVPGGLGAIKAGANYAASLQAAQLARAKGFDQVLWLDVDRDAIEEVGTMNVFFVFKNEVVTPALNGAILPGCVRDSSLQILRQGDRPVIERKITMSEVLERHSKGELLEAFGTGTAAVISPIGELSFKNQPYRINNGEVGPVAKNLLTTIHEIQRGIRPDPYGWVRPLLSL